MADTKISGLSLATNPLNTDLVPVVIDSGGTWLSRKIEVADLLKGGFKTTATAAGTTTLTSADRTLQFFTGVTTQTVVLPDATTLTQGRSYIIHNNSTGEVTVDASGGAQLCILQGDTNARFTVTDVTTSAGVWDTELASQIRENASTSSVTGFATDTYLAGSFLRFPYPPAIGTSYRLVFDVTKTAAGTATPIINIRVGTQGTVTNDTARHTFTFGAGTAAVDTGVFEILVTYRSVGSSGVSLGLAKLTNNLTTTGLSNAVKARTSTSAGYTTTTEALGIGASYNGGASASHTVTLVKAELVM